MVLDFLKDWQQSLIPSKETLYGKKGKNKQLKTVDPAQEQLLALINEGLTKGTGPFAETFGKFNEEDFNKGVKDPAMKNFLEEILPQVQEKYIANNQSTGSAINRARNKAGVDFSSKLAELLYNAKQGQKQNQIAGAQTALGKQTVENLYTKPTEGLVQGAIKGLTSGVAQAAGAGIVG